MIEAKLIAYLNDHLSAPVKASMIKPEQPLPSAFVVCEKTGDGQVNLVRTATFAVQSYGPSLLDAASLSETVYQIMDGFVAESNVFRCKRISDYNFTDTDTKEYRYQSVYEIVYMEV